MTSLLSAESQPGRSFFGPLRGFESRPDFRSTTVSAERSSHDSTLGEIEELGRRCRAGEIEAWSALFPKVWPVLVTFVHRLYHSFDRQDAEDVAQTSLAAAMRSAQMFSGPGLFRAWLFGIATRQAATLHRARSARKRGAQLLVPLDQASERSDEAPSPAETVAENDRAQILHRAIDELVEADRDLVHLHFFGELTFREIAQVRQMNPKTVCTRLTRCKEKLHHLLLRSHLSDANG